MKLKKLLLKVEDFLNAEDRARAEQMDSMREVLDALKKKERDLKTQAKDEQDPDERENFEKKREVVHAQRKKGLAALKALQKS